MKKCPKCEKIYENSSHICTQCNITLLQTKGSLNSVHCNMCNYEYWEDSEDHEKWKELSSKSVCPTCGGELEQRIQLIVTDEQKQRSKDFVNRTTQAIGKITDYADKEGKRRARYLQIIIDPNNVPDNLITEHNRLSSIQLGHSAIFIISIIILLFAKKFILILPVVIIGIVYNFIYEYFCIKKLAEKYNFTQYEMVNILSKLKELHTRKKVKEKSSKRLKNSVEKLQF